MDSPKPAAPPRALTLHLAAWGALAMVMFAITWGTFSEWIGASVWQVLGRALLWGAQGAVLTGLLALPYRWLFADSRLTAGRIAWMVAASVGVGFVWALAFDWSYWPLPQDPAAMLDSPPRQPRGRFAGGTLPFSILAVAWSFVWVGVQGMFAAQRDRELALTAQKEVLAAQKAAAEARLQALGAELQPHFLFNALNTVVGAVEDGNPEGARKVVEGLAEILRYSLDRGRTEVSLGEELAALRTYLAIESTRFEANLVVQWEVDPATEGARIPAMILHPLVENAIKHGFQTSPMPLKIRIGAAHDGEALKLWVANTGKLKPARPGAVGLRNVRERLGILYPDRHGFELEQEGEEVVVTLFLEVKP